MRTELIVLIGLVGVESSCVAQGTVVFNNGTGLIQQWTSLFDQTLIPVPAGCTGCEVQLLYAPAGTAHGQWWAFQPPDEWVAANPGWMLGPMANLGTTQAGKFDGGVVTLTGIPMGANASYALYGWAPETRPLYYISDFYQWRSDVFTTATGGGVTPAVALADSFGGMILQPLLLIPEPATSSLLALGMLSLLVLRWRQP